MKERKFESIQKAIEEWKQTEDAINWAYSMVYSIEENMTENIRFYNINEVYEWIEQDYYNDDNYGNKETTPIEEIINNYIKNLNVDNDIAELIKTGIFDWGLDDLFGENILGIFYENKEIKYWIEYWYKKVNDYTFQVYVTGNGGFEPDDYYKESEYVKEYYNKWLEERRKRINDDEWNTFYNKMEINVREVFENKLQKMRW